MLHLRNNHFNAKDFTFRLLDKALHHLTIDSRELKVKILHTCKSLRNCNEQEFTEIMKAPNV